MKKNILLLFPILFFISCSLFSPMKQITDKVINQEVIDTNDLADFEKDDLRILRNTIFAQYGYPFELKEYFYENKPFGYSFTRDEAYSNDSLTDIDKKNINTILTTESHLGVEPDEVERQNIKNELLNGLTSTQIYSLIQGDIISFYPELRSKFNTELKRKYFQESDEYTEYVPQFQALREGVKGHYFTKDITNQIELDNYDLDAGGFFFLKGKDDWALGNKGVYHLSTTSIATSIDGFYSDDDVFPFYDAGYYNDRFSLLFISCSEREGLAIENNRERIQFLLSFSVEFEDDNLNKDDFEFYIRTKKIVKIKNVKYQILLDGKVLAEKHIE